MSVLTKDYTVLDLARDAHDADFRNRVATARDTIAWAQQAPAIPPWECQSGCGNTLVISDRGGICRQCAIEARPATRDGS
jgi:hypothetical protein